MKRFAFRLERLLQLRAAAERAQARQLVQALREEAADREAVRESEVRLAEARAQLVTTPKELSQAGTLRNLELAIDALADQVRALSLTHERSLERVETERHGFEQARMARRVIERLREHRREVWGDELARYEQGESDENALQQARSNGREAV
jgi:flagellar export protein FliJ